MDDEGTSEDNLSSSEDNNASDFDGEDTSDESDEGVTGDDMAGGNNHGQESGSDIGESPSITMILILLSIIGFSRMRNLKRKD